MIGFLKGQIRLVNEDSIVLDCNGVGYKIYTKIAGGRVGDEEEFFVYTHVRETEISLYGFSDEKDMKVFEYLLGVNGVGPKVGMTLINELGATNIINAVLNKEPKGLDVTGVGEKTANKIIIELNSKFDSLGWRVESGQEEGTGKNEVYREATQALVSLGYHRKDINDAINSFKEDHSNDDYSVEELVKLLLKYMR